MQISFKLKRKYYNFRKKLESKVVLNEREAKVIEIVKYQLTKSDCDLITAPISGNRYITSGDKQLTIVLTGLNAIVSNHTFHYDISLGKDAVRILTQKFDKILESRRRIAEREIMKNMLDSLSSLAQD